MWDFIFGVAAGAVGAVVVTKALEKQENKDLATKLVDNVESACERACEKVKAALH